MNKIIRPQEPDFLAENAQKWNDTFAKNRAKKPNFKFQWATPKGKKKRVNILLLPTLCQMTQSHCAFCDSDNFATSLKTIEHFRPKDTFPHLAYTWTNLFLCCNACQNAKGEKFEETLLKPDETEYQFSTYFQCNFKTGELEPNAIATDAQKVQASDTIRLYDLNREDLCIFRLKEAKRWKRRGEDEILDDFGYRYFIE